MDVLRRDFLKYCVGSAAALGLEFSTLGTLEKALAAGGGKSPTYPIAPGVIYTTRDRTIVPVGHPQGTYPPSQPPYATIMPCQISLYTANGYGEWEKDAEGYPDGQGVDFGCPDMQTGFVSSPSDPDPSAATLLSFFTMSDLHICDKESPARAIYYGYQYPQPIVPANNTPAGNSSCYSGIILYTTHVLDAAIQTINALHKVNPFDFGISLGDAADNTQFNELRWYLNVLDGKMITPSSGAHLGANIIDYQKPYKAAGLDKSIKWYQAIGNHDQFWMGTALMNNYLRKTLVGSHVLSLGQVTTSPPDWPEIMNGRDCYMGVVDGSTPYGEIIHAGDVHSQPVPKIVADPKRRSLSISDWMSEFFDTTSEPAGHGFTRKMVKEGFACYHFYPRADIPIKIIVLDDTNKAGGAAGALDEKRYKWLLGELQDGQDADELMIICAHIPVAPYGYPTIWTTDSVISDTALITELHNYPNLIMWIAGHIHRNTITPKPSTIGGNPGYGFWEVETPSLRDHPQQFRRFEILRNSDNMTLSILVIDVDPAANPAPLGDGSSSPALISRSYAMAAQQIFGNPWQQGAGMDPSSCVYNAQLVIQLSQLSTGLQTKIQDISPVVGSFKISRNGARPKSRVVTLNNTVAGSVPIEYMASEYSGFSGAAWQPYSNNPTLTLSSTKGATTVYFKVRDGSGKESAVAKGSIRLAG